MGQRAKCGVAGLSGRMTRVAVPALALALTGCGGGVKAPMEHLPEGGAYIVIDAAKARTSPAVKKGMELSEGGASAGRASFDKMEKAYLSIDMSKGMPALTGVATGTAGFAAAAATDMKAQGAAETTVEGRKAIQGKGGPNGGGGYVTELADNAVAVFGAPADLARMTGAAAKKVPAASEKPLFQRAKALSADHALVIVVDPAPIMAQAGRGIDQMAQANPAGAAAIRKTEALTLTADWQTAPKVQVTLVGPAEGRADVVKLLETLKGFAPMMAGAARGQGPGGKLAIGVVGRMEIAEAKDGVSVTIAWTEDEATGLLGRLDAVKSAGSPMEKAKAAQEALLGK